MAKTEDYQKGQDDHNQGRLQAGSREYRRGWSDQSIRTNQRTNADRRQGGK